MRTHVVFLHPPDARPTGEDLDVLSVAEAGWFVHLLKRVDGLEVDDDLCQEDWGVVVFASRRGKKFWIGLSLMDEGGEWLAHFHESWGLRRLFSKSGPEFAQLIVDFHTTISSNPKVSKVRWYQEKDLNHADAESADAPAG